VEVTCALLCDAATVREGLLHILGGCVNRLVRQQFPAPMGTSLGLALAVHRTEAQTDHQVQIVVQMEDGQRIAEVGAGFQVGEPAEGQLRPGEQINVPLAVPLGPVGLPAAGGYSIEVLIDGVHKVSVPFWAILQASPPALGA